MGLDCQASQALECQRMYACVLNWVQEVGKHMRGGVWMGADAAVDEVVQGGDSLAAVDSLCQLIRTDVVTY